jgi:hypothetical protein
MKKFNMEEIDDSIIQDLIDHCEDNMASPYKEKAKAKVVVAKMEEPSEDEESMMVGGEKSSDEDEMSDEDKEKLMELYRSLKD